MSRRRVTNFTLQCQVEIAIEQLVNWRNCAISYTQLTPCCKWYRGKEGTSFFTLVQKKNDTPEWEAKIHFDVMQSCEPDVNGWHGSQKATHTEIHIYTCRVWQIFVHLSCFGRGSYLCSLCRQVCKITGKYFTAVALFVASILHVIWFFSMEQEGVVPPRLYHYNAWYFHTFISHEFDLVQYYYYCGLFFGRGTLGTMQIASTRFGFDGVLRAYQQPKPSIMQQVLEACSPGLSSGIARGSRLP